MREKIRFNDHWKYRAGNDLPPATRHKGPMYLSAKTEHRRWGPACRDYEPDDYQRDRPFNMESWEDVTLPHDFIIRQTPNAEFNEALGFFNYHNGWYRKEFELPAEDRDKRLTLLFEGVATHCTVYLNGCVLKHNFCSYNTFEVNITDFAKFGEKNVLAVYVKAAEHEGWWYSGGGIYRNVWLIKTHPVAIDLWGVYTVPHKQADGSWRIEIETTVCNDTFKPQTVTAETVIYDQSGAVAASGRGTAELGLRAKGTVRCSAALGTAHLWDIDDPYLYSAVTTLYIDGVPVDTDRTRFGCRTYRLDPEEGLILNGRHVKINGVCAHQDFGLTGRAVADNIYRYRIEMIKDMGANAYRTSHYPHAEATMDALDELGFIVMDEFRWFSSSDECMEQARMLIRRDRNRPSVFFWSIGNEEPHHLTEEGRRICQSLMAEIKKLDNTRVMMTAVSDNPTEATVYDELDAIGINYNLQAYDALHEKYPAKAVFSSECCATGTTRGWYLDSDPVRGYVDAYDKDTTTWFLGREKTWKFLNSRKWIAGGYQWDAFEHRGEAAWPRLCSVSGAIDMYMQKKDAFYQNQSLWLDTPMIHLLPHWNWSWRTNEPIRVVAYTNCEEAELFLNGESLGRQKIERFGHGEWQVQFAPGRLEVRGYNDGAEAACDVRQTTGAPASLQLRLDNQIHEANGRDVAVVTCTCLDENGLEVPDAAPFVSFSANHLGMVIGTGSDNTDHIPPHIPDRRMMAGKITCGVQVGTEAGTLMVYAAANGLKGAALAIPLVACEEGKE